LVGWQEGHPARKKWGDGRRWALISPDGVVPSRLVGVSASVNLPLHHKVQKFSCGTGHMCGPGKRAVKWLWLCGSRGPLSQQVEEDDQWRQLTQVHLEKY